MKTEEILISPSLALKMLEKNTINRPIRENYVKTLAKEMIEGRWVKNTGIPILLNGDGTIIDGQHRLHAIILSKMSIRFTITHGIEKDVIDVIDTPLVRTAGDILGMNGVKHYTATAAIIKYYLMNGIAGGAKSAHYSSGRPTNKYIHEIYNSDIVFWDNCSDRAVKYNREFKPITRAVFGGCLSLALKESNFPLKVNDFFDQLAFGKNCDDSVMILRKKFINNQLSQRKLTPGAKRDLIQGHFNAFIKHQRNPYLTNDKTWL